MNTKKQRKPSRSDPRGARSNYFSQPSGDPVVELSSALSKVDTKSKEAKLNEASMDDNNGSRIWFNWLFGQRVKKKENK